MSMLEQMGVALGLASLAGVNLYLTVLLAGLAIRFDVLQLAAQHQNLEVLGHPLVLIAAAVLCAIEFVADKVPWLDTLWDTVHTVIRPLGGMVLGLQALGEMPAYLQVVAGLVAGGAALTTHGVKAGARLVMNHSPEPVTNVSMSLTEDAAVAGGLALTLLHPAVGLAVFAGILVICWLAFPRLWRAARATWWLVWRKLQMPGRPAAAAAAVELPLQVDASLRDVLLYKGGVAEKEVRATVRCLTGKGKGVRGLSVNLDGLLVLTHEMTHLYFMAAKGLRERLFRIPVSGMRAAVESKFLSENLVLEASHVKAVFRFPRGQGEVAEAVARVIEEAQQGLGKKMEALGSEAEPGEVEVAPASEIGLSSHQETGVEAGTEAAGKSSPSIERPS